MLNIIFAKDRNNGLLLNNKINPFRINIMMCNTGNHIDNFLHTYKVL